MNTKTQATVSLTPDLFQRCTVLERDGMTSIGEVVRQALQHPAGLRGLERDHLVKPARKVARTPVGDRKRSIVIGLEPELRDRCDALRIVLGASRADIIRQALQGEGLAALELANAIRIGQLHALARRRGHTDWRGFVRELVLDRPGGKPRQNLPTLEELEGGVAAARDHLPAQPNAKLTPGQVEQIVEQRQAGETLHAIAARYRVSESLVSRICAGKRRAA